MQFACLGRDADPTPPTLGGPQLRSSAPSQLLNPHRCVGSLRQEPEPLAVLLGSPNEALHLLGVRADVLSKVLNHCRGTKGQLR